MLYCIYGGVTTPTEAAAVAAFYALILASIFYRALSFSNFYRILVESARSSAAVGLVIGGALILNYIVASENIPDIIAGYLVGLDVSPLLFLIGVNILIPAYQKIFFLQLSSLLLGWFRLYRLVLNRVKAQ